jgi:uncharacterized protein with PQ loop repeat
MVDALHHLHVRQRLYRRLEKFPHPNFFKRTLDRLMYFVALVSPAALVPQVWQVYATQDVAGLAISSWALLFTINMLWTIYSIVHREWPLFIATSSMGILDATLIMGIFLYR